MDTKDKVAVITGGASGIGETTARLLSGQGVRVMLGDVNEKKLERVAGEIKSAGGQASYAVCNVTSEKDTAALMDRALDEFGAINFVVPCAGVIRDSLFVSTDKKTGKVKKFMDLDKWQTVIDINLTGTFLTLREAAVRMIDNNCPGVLFTISSIQKQGGIGQLNYSSTKAALALWPKILVGEFQMKNIHDIRVVSIAPGYVGTEMVRNMNQKALDSILSQVPLNRLIEPDEIAGLVLSVIGNDAINATCLEITGGIISGMIAK